MPAFNYFDVDSNRYLNLVALNYEVKVAQGSGTPVYDVEESVDSTETLALRPANGLGQLHRYGSNALGGGIFWSLAILPLLLLGGFFYYDRHQQLLVNRDPAEVARQRAAKLANDRLKSAEKELKAGSPRAFYDAIEDAVLGYLRDKFQLPIVELSKKNIHQELLTHGAETELADAYVELLQRCEMALYAGQDQVSDLAATYEQAKGLILRTEKV
jgi:hypothetical protein